jgi:hypothetical protein
MRFPEYDAGGWELWEEEDYGYAERSRGQEEDLEDA